LVPRFSSGDASRPARVTGAQIRLILQGFFYHCFFLRTRPNRAACFLLYSEENFNQKEKANDFEVRGFVNHPRFNAAWEMT